MSTKTQTAKTASASQNRVKVAKHNLAIAIDDLKKTHTASACQKTPTIAELQVQETLAVNRLQHLENAIGEIQHLKRSVYDLTDSRAKVARHAEALAEALRALLAKLDNITSNAFALAAEREEREAAREALANWEGAK